jgi:ribosomal protein S18 acetylase RimI-like enzyme
MEIDLAALAVTEATSDDVRALSDLLTESWREAGPGAAGFGGATDQVIAEISAPEAVAALIDDPRRRVFLAMTGGRPVGFAATRALDDTRVELAGIIVLREAAGLGVGTALVAQAVEEARTAGFEVMVVHTETTNDTAITFYEHRGFSATGTEVDDVDGVGVEVLVLERTL